MTDYSGNSRDWERGDCIDCGSRLLRMLGEQPHRDCTDLAADLERGVKPEQIAREAIDRYHMVAEQSRTVFWEVDAQGLYTHVSHVCRQVWGYEPVELINRKHFFDLYPKDGRGQFRDSIFARFARRERFRDFQNPVVCKDGRTIWVSTTAVPLVDETGQLVGYRGSDSDVSERHEAERALQAERTKLANVIEGTNAGTWEWNVETGETAFNERWAEIIGYSLDQLQPVSIETWLSRLHPDDRDLSRSKLEDHFAGGSANYDCELRMRHRDGYWVWVHDRGKVTEWTPDGKPLRMAGTHTDITERKRSEQALKESRRQLQLAIAASELAQERFRLHLQGTPLAYVEMDTAGRITCWNPAAAQLFGRTREQAVGLHASDVLALAEPQRHEGRFLELIDSAGTPRLTLEHLTGAGQRISCEWSSTRLVNAEGQAIGLSCLGQNVTDLLQALESLRRSKEMAEAATKAKSEFLSTMSHEIRTPMNGILGMSGLLLESRLNPEQMSFAEAIRSSAEALLSIINDILDFSKVEAGRLEVESVPFNLQTAIEEVVELVVLQAHRKHLDLAVWYPPGTPRVFEGDVGRIRQILLNLVNNAIKFTDAGHVLVEVACEPHGVVSIAVQDTGVGIAPEKFDLLFTHFTQLDSSPKRRHGGSGLGLAISLRLARLMGGDIRVVSQPGEGSTFTLRLPLPVRTDPAEDPPHTRNRELAGVRVLIVETHQVSRFVHAEWCAGWGMRVEESSSLADALLRMEQAFTTESDPFAVLVVERLLPDGDGISVAAQLQEAAGRSGAHLPVVLMNGYDFQHTDLARLAGLAAAMANPTRPAQLREALLRALHRDRPARAPGGDQAPDRTRTPTACSALPPPQPETRVLLVEDNAINQKVAASLLKKLGCHVEIAGNGREALHLIERVPFDLVFMDCQMPDMDGFEASGAIRRMPEPLCGVPIIALTAGAMEADRKRCLEAGMNDYLAKPVTPEALRAMLRAWCLRRDVVPV